MAGKPGGVHPLKDLGADCLRHKVTLSRAITWVRLDEFGITNHPHHRGHLGARRENSVKAGNRPHRGKLAGESVGVDTPGTWKVS